MKTCEKCKAENADTSAVCWKCGEVLPVTDAWAASLRQGAKTAAPAKTREAAKGAAEKGPGEAAPWGPTLAGMGLTLTLCAFLAGVMNAGLVMSLGAALSVGAMIRTNAERNSSDVALSIALLSLFIFVICVIVYIGNYSKALFPGS